MLHTFGCSGRGKRWRVQAGEGVAIDDVVIRIPDEMPQFPIQCQQGCQCHHANIQRLSCCGATG